MRGHVEKKRSRYYVVLELDLERDPETDERIRTRAGAGSFRTRREADAALSDALEASRRGWRGPSRVSLAEYLRDEWLPGVDLERAPTTAALYRTLMEAYVIPRLGGRRLEQIHAADLTKLYAELLACGGRGKRLPSGDRATRTLAPKTVRHVHTTLRKALGDAVAARHLSWNPAEAAKAPKVAPTKEPATWSAEQVAAFLEHVAGDRLEALWVLGATSGMRRGELLGLRWIDVGSDELAIRQVYVAYGKLHAFKEPKTAASRRTIPLPPRAVGALKAHRKRQAAEKLAAGPVYEDRGLVFADEIGDPLSPDMISASFRALVKAAGLPRLTIHGLRHTFATLGLDAGADVLDVAAMLGHSSPAITQAIYQHTRPERLRKASEAIEGAIFG